MWIFYEHMLGSQAENHCHGWESLILRYLLRLLCAWHRESNNQQSACPYEQSYSLMGKEDNRQVTKFQTVISAVKKVSRIRKWRMKRRKVVILKRPEEMASCLTFSRYLNEYYLGKSFLGRRASAQALRQECT